MVRSRPTMTAILRFRAIDRSDPARRARRLPTSAQRLLGRPAASSPEARVSIDVGAMPNAGMISGQVWHDADHDNTPDGIEQPLAGWTVDLLLNGQPVRSMVTDS